MHIDHLSLIALKKSCPEDAMPHNLLWDMGATGLVHLLYDCTTGAESDADGRGDRARRFRTKRREQWPSV